MICLKNSHGELEQGGIAQYYDGAWKDAISYGNGTFGVNTTKSSLSLRMTYAGATQTKSNVPVGTDTIVFQTVNAAVQLRNSTGALMDTGTVQYYAGAWREFGVTKNGAANKELLPGTYSFRMTYGYASKDTAQDIGVNPTVTFTTRNTQVQLKNSTGALIDPGSVQYYAGAWRPFGVTANGVASKELLPGNYSFRMTFEFASKDTAQNISANPLVTFTTVKSTVQLKNSTDAPIDTGSVQYYAGAWRPYGATVNGAVSKELLPNSYSFRMTYASASVDKVQHIASDPIVIFRTVNTAVQLKNSQGTLIDGGSVQYYAGAWRPFGAMIGGTATKELLPASYSFRMTHESVSNDKTQNVGTDPSVLFSTIPVMISVKNLQNAPVSNAAVTYYSGAWRTFGTTAAGGAVSKELLPATLQFRAKAGSAQQDKTQNTGADPVVNIQLNVVQ